MIRLAAISVGLGLLATGTGYLMIQLGGWGSCGPASNTAYVGGILSGILLPWIAPIPPTLALLAAPCVWTCLAFVGLRTCLGDQGRPEKR